MKRIFYLLFFLIPIYTQAQVVVDKIIAVVGDQFILDSELEIRYREEKSQWGADVKQAKCALLFQMIQEKLLIIQAGRDSVTVSDDELENQMSNRLNYFIQQFGSEEAIEEVFKKSMDEIKAELKTSLGQQLLVNKMHGTLFGEIQVSPSEVRKYYRSQSKDSLPFYNSEYEVGQLVRQFKVSRAEKEAAYRKMKRIRDEIVSGNEDFEFSATFHSDDPGSQPKGGNLGWVNRNDLVPEFSAAAFRLKKDSISEIVETQFGYHIIQMIDRAGENINVRHILIKPKIRTKDRERTKRFLDSIRYQIINDTLTFEQAAYKYSQDEETKNNAGIMYDPTNSSTKISVDNMDPSLVYLLDTLKTGEISAPAAMITHEGNEAIRIVLLKSKIKPHLANLDQDYPRISELALQIKIKKTINQWSYRKISTVYLKVDENYRDCKQIRKLITENLTTH